MNPGRPPVRPRVMLLPFDEQQQPWQWFEEAVRDLLRRLPQFRNVEAYGVQGDHQEGIDIRADADDGHVGIQCKKETQFGPQAVADAVADATYPADRFILALSRRATVKARRELDKYPNWEFWDQTRLSDAVRSLPPAEAADYVGRHFHQAYIEDFLGFGRPTTFIDRDSAVAPLRDTSKLIHQGWARVDDGGALEALRAFVNSDQTIALVDGPIGSGKTKLVVDLTEPDLGRPVYFLAAGAPITSEGLREVRPGPALIVIDNADDVAGLPLLYQYLLLHVDQKAILTTSTGMLPQIRQELAKGSIEPPDICPIALGRLSRDATIALARQVLGRTEAEAEEALVQNAADCPLTTILTARLLRDRTTTPDAIRAQGDVRDHVRALYREVATGAVAPDVPHDDVKAVLQLIAALGPARIEHDEWLAPAATVLGWDEERLLRVLDAVDDARILNRRGGLYSVAPEFLRQSIMLEACIVRNRPTTFSARVLEHFPLDQQLLLNLAIADLESRASDGPELFRGPWAAVSQGVRNGTSADRSHFLHKLDELGYVKPDEVYELVTYLMAHPATNDDQQPFAEFGYAIEHKSVVREVPRVLRRVMMASRERIRGCIELLWGLGKDVTAWTSGEGPIRTVADLARYELGVGTGRAAAIVEAVASMIARGEADTPAHSLLEMIAPVLTRDIETYLSQGTHLLVRRALLAVESARELRDRAIGVVAEAVGGPNARRADTAIKLLTDVLRNPEHLTAEPPPETQAAWDHERAAAFDAYDRVADANEYPIRALRIEHELPFYAQYSPSALVRERSTAVLAQIAAVPRRNRYRVLIPQFMWSNGFVDVRVEQDWQLGEQRRAEFITATTVDIFAETNDAEVIIADVIARIAMIEEAGLQGSPRDLFAEIERQRPDLTPAFIETLIGAGEPQRYPWLDTFLRATFLRDPSAGEALAQRLFALGNLNAGIAVANALVYVSPRADQDWAIRSHHLHTLLTHEDAGLRLAGASVLPYFRNADLHAAVSALVLAANVGTDAVMADKLYSALPNDLADLDDATREALAVKLVPLSALEYWPMTYLSRLATTHSRLVLEVVADRLFSDRPYKEYQALPFGDHNMNPIVQGLTASPTFADDLREVMRERAGADDAALSRFTGFLGHIAREAPDLVRGMIDEAIASDNGGLQRAALRWVRNLPHDMIEEDVPWVVGLLERAHAISPEMGQHAQSAIFAELITGAENVGHYEGAPSDMRAQAIAQEALARDDLSVAVRRFFTDLAEHGRRAEDATINRAEEAFGTQ